jgi:DNA-binding response OmpR family regulator
MIDAEQPVPWRCTLLDPCEAIKDKGDLEGKRVLVACEEEDVCDLLETLLQDAVSLPIARANHAAHVFEVAQEMPTALLLLTLGYARGAMLAGLEQFKANPAAGTIPVLVLSADTSACHSALRAGADAFLPMPFEVAALQLRVCELLGRS